ncbi:MAG: 23S rRNA (guanosine(2251)-2'-O)-methyltransferase RlmB [Oscillospiraceae bacterium]|nr:23S rRNA (guanosine(2251)-2'-O)-methyltransferase RlmB [Oscillospiraceae bacterium]
MSFTYDSNNDQNSNEENLKSEIIVGRNSVIAALSSLQRDIECIYLLKGSELSKTPGKILALAKQKGIPVKEAAQGKFDALCHGENHQGVAAVVSAYKYSSVEDIVAKSDENGSFIIICDGIEDPHNLGAIIRTAEASGVSGVIIPKRRSAGLSPAVCKASAGAVEFMPVARVTNISNLITDLQKLGYWVYAADVGGTPWKKADYRGKVAVVIGSEGFGISRLVKEHCDAVVSIPMFGQTNSLNASVAAAIIMYEASSQRNNI